MTLTAKQLPLERVHRTLGALGWDVDVFTARYHLETETEAPPPPAQTLAGARDALEAARDAYEAAAERARERATADLPRYSVAVAAQRLGINPRTLRRHLQRGLARAWVTDARSPAGQRYRFDEQQLADYAARRFHLSRRDEERDPT